MVTSFHLCHSLSGYHGIDPTYDSLQKGTDATPQSTLQGSVELLWGAGEGGTRGMTTQGQLRSPAIRCHPGMALILSETREHSFPLCDGFESFVVVQMQHMLRLRRDHNQEHSR